MAETGELKVRFTPAAEKFIRRIMRFTIEPQAGFRLKVRPGGCSGLGVEFDIAQELAANEAVVEHSGLRIFLDTESRMLLDGATVDFKESLGQTGFTVSTPNVVVQSCSPASTIVLLGELTRR
jgi:iron-sulfur cluster assembly protein